MYTRWRLEWVWNGDGSVSIERSQSDCAASIPEPVEAIGNGIDVALGARIRIRFPPCRRVWIGATPAFEPPDLLSENRLPTLKNPDPESGTAIVELSLVDSNQMLHTSPAEGSRCRLTLELEDLTL